jgi:hypothetical protein
MDIFFNRIKASVLKSLGGELKDISKVCWCVIEEVEKFPIVITGEEKLLLAIQYIEKILADSGETTPPEILQLTASFISRLIDASNGSLQVNKTKQVAAPVVAVAAADSDSSSITAPTKKKGFLRK